MPDVLVLGAGPSGSVAATLLLARGLSVRIVEQARFPRFSIGESLLAHTTGLLDEAGLLRPVLAGGFQFKNGAAFTRGATYTEFNFAEKSSTGPGFTFQVPRARFDAILADEAAGRGADVRYETRVVAASFDAQGPRVTTVDARGTTETVAPRFVLDATGFGRVLPRLLSLETPSTLPVRSALYTQVEDRIPAGAFDRQKIRIVVHPEHPQVWFWLIPFSDGRASLGVVADASFLAARTGSNEERLFGLAHEDPGLARLLPSPTPLFAVGELRGYSANVTRMWGPGWALLGNAAEFLDPVFSSGVTIALRSAHLAAPCVARTLGGETVDWDGEFEKPLRVGVDTFRHFVEGWYSGDLQDVIFHPREKQDARIREHVCSILAGYAWDPANPFVGRGRHRLAALAELCRRTA